MVTIQDLSHVQELREFVERHQFALLQRDCATQCGMKTSMTSVVVNGCTPSTKVGSSILNGHPNFENILDTAKTTRKARTRLSPLLFTTFGRYLGVSTTIVAALETLLLLVMPKSMEPLLALSCPLPIQGHTFGPSMTEKSPERTKPSP